MFNLISSANAETPALEFTKPLPASVAKSIHDMVTNEIMRENAALRRPHGIVPDALDFFVHMIVAGIDPVIIIPALLAGFIAKSRKSVSVVGLVTACLVAALVVVLDYSAHHYDGVIMRRSVSFDLPMHAAAVFADVWIEAMIFRELIALFWRRKPSVKPA
jgi:hypothetical protein